VQRTQNFALIAGGAAVSKSDKYPTSSLLNRARLAAFGFIYFNVQVIKKLEPVLALAKVAFYELSNFCALQCRRVN